MTLDLSSLSDISALIRGQDTGNGIRKVKVDVIQPDTNQPRKAFDESALAELAASIQSVGIIQPPVVRTHTDGYMLISGERRWRAARQLGWEKIDVIVRDDLNAHAQMVENIQREALSAWEIYRVIAGELDAGAKQVDLAAAFGKSKQWVEAYAAVRKMPEVLVTALRENRVVGITVMGRLHRLHNDRPDVARRLLDSPEPITRGMIADAIAEISARRLAVTFNPPPSSLSITTAGLDMPAVDEGGGKGEDENTAVVETSAPESCLKASKPLPIRIRACYEDASWVVNYAQQQIGADGKRLVLLQGEGGLQRFEPLGALKLESIECL
ncbi:MAG TPA: ParB/RepB/Spo0J family partition protein [Rhodanobacteraceae bacterium]|jgi:ParB/RepB/Spo0J family partition protein|nr:ParB/RepB/Spo0J family partition protein [Rhodanobacteraceae bacterium]